MNLSELIDTHRGARSYSELSRDCGGAPTDKRLQQMVRSSIKNFPDPPTIKALARGLRVPEAEIVLAAAESLGLDVRRERPRVMELMPDTAGDLTEEQASAVAHLVSVFTKDARDVRYIKAWVNDMLREIDETVSLDHLERIQLAVDQAADDQNIDRQQWRLLTEAARARAREVDERREPVVADVLAARLSVAEQAFADDVAGTPVDFVFSDFHLDVLRQVTVVAMAGSGKTMSLLAALDSIGRQPRDWDQALEGLSELYLADQVSRDAYVDVVEQVKELAYAGAAPVAARKGTRRRSITDRAQNEAGEHDQDPGGMDPS